MWCAVFDQAHPYRGVGSYNVYAYSSPSFYWVCTHHVITKPEEPLSKIIKVIVMMSYDFFKMIVLNIYLGSFSCCC